MIFGGTEVPRRYIGAYLTDDEKFLIISAANTTTGNELYVQDLSKPGSKIVNILSGFGSSTNIIDNDGETFYVQTNLNAPNNKLVKMNIRQPESKNWVDVIPETEHVLNVSTGGGYLFANYLKDAISVIEQYDYTGKKIREIQLPGVGSAGGFSGKKKRKRFIMVSLIISPHRQALNLMWTMDNLRFILSQK